MKAGIVLVNNRGAAEITNTAAREIQDKFRHDENPFVPEKLSQILLHSGEETHALIRLLCQRQTEIMNALPLSV